MACVHRPAVLLDIKGVKKPADGCWIRTFSGKSKSWNDGGVADIVAVSKAKLSHAPEPVYGCVAMVSDQQMSLLDKFEGVPRVYNRYRAVCLVGDRKDKVEAVVYLRVKKKAFRMPAESYKCAVLHNVQQHHPSLSTLSILTGSGGLVEIWSRPAAGDLTLSGLLFSVGIGLANPPVMPHAVRDWREALASKMRITSTGELVKALGVLRDEEVLRQVHPAFDLALLSALRRTLGGDGVGAVMCVH